MSKIFDGSFRKNSVKGFYQYSVKIAQIRSFPWSVFSCIRTKCGDLLRKSPYSVRIQKKYGPEKTPYLHTFYAVAPSKMFDKVLIRVRRIVTCRYSWKNTRALFKKYCAKFIPDKTKQNMRDYKKKGTLILNNYIHFGCP